MSSQISLSKLISEKIIVRGREVFVGLDVHSKQWTINIRAEQTERFHAVMPPTYESLCKIFKRLPECKIKTAYEAGPHGFSLYDRLTSDGYDCLVIPPTTMLCEKHNKIKTDRRDARQIASFLEKNLLKSVYVLTPEERSHRQLMRTRHQMVEHRSACANQIKSLLLFHGITCPIPETQHWGKIYMNWLSELELPFAELKFSLEMLVKLYQELTVHIKDIEKQLRGLSRSNQYQEAVARIDSIPGFGWLSALEFVLEVPDLERFETPDKLASYLGVVPSENSSGEREQKGSITHAGNNRIRAMLTENAWVLIRFDEKWAEKYARLKHRRGAYKAIVAVARGVVGIIWTLFRKEDHYRYMQAA
jgi:transposase